MNDVMIRLCSQRVNNSGSSVLLLVGSLLIDDATKHEPARNPSSDWRSHTQSITGTY